MEAKASIRASIAQKAGAGAGAATGCLHCPVEQTVRGYGIAFCGAMYGCSLMYLSLDPALCDTTVDECDC